MIPSPTLKVLFTMQKHQVKALLMGGQACVWYGAAEFSRDTDLVVLVEPENILRLRSALDELQAECITVPSFDPKYLERGHAIHFRCHHPEVEGLRVDIMSKMRGVAPFPELWLRRETLQDDEGNNYELLSLPDLIRAKKTQREKDWPMVRRLIEAHYLRHRSEPTTERIKFWFQELRTPEFLVVLAQQSPAICDQMTKLRSLLKDAFTGDTDQLAEGLAAEMAAESSNDRNYWAPLKRELEQLRRIRGTN